MRSRLQLALLTLFVLCTTISLTKFFRTDPALICGPSDFALLALSLGVLFIYSGHLVQRGLTQYFRQRFRHSARNVIRRKDRLEAQQTALLKIATSQSALDGDFTAVAHEISEIIAQTMNVEQASVWLFQEKSSRFTCVDSYSRLSLLHSCKMGIEEHVAPLLVKRIRTHRVLVVQDLARHRWRKDFVHHVDDHIHGLLLAPIRHAAKVVGFVEVADICLSRSWESDEQNFLASLADMLAMALLNTHQRHIKAELQLKSSAIESSKDGIGILDGDGIFLSMNKAYALMHGFPDPDDLIGKPWQVLYDRKEAERFENFLFPRFRQHGSLSVEVTGRKRDGTLFPQEVSLTHFKDGGMIWIIRDITIRRRVERTAEQIALFATLNPSPVLRFSAEGKILMANPAAAEILQLRHETGEHLHEVVPELKDIDFQSCITRGSITTGTAHIQNKTFLFTLKGIPDLCVGHAYGNDITELKVAEQKIIESEKFLRLVIDSNPNLIFVKDGEGRFSLVNQAVADIYGTTVGELIGKTDADFNDCQSEVDFFREKDQQVLSDQSELFIPEEIITDSQGVLHWLQTVKCPLQLSEAHEAYVLGVATDITERKKLEDQLAQSQKLEAIGQLAGGIAHDFNNLLTGILGYTSLLLQSRESDPEIFHTAQQIENTANKAAQLTQKLLGFARKGKHQNVSIDLHQSIKETLSLLRRTIEKNVTIRPFLEAQHSHIKGDPVQIQQILLNLAINARDAMHRSGSEASGGTLTIRTSNQVIDYRSPAQFSDLSPGKYLCFEVSDTGCGIPTHQREKIFEPFFTTKEAGRGTGMGLAMVYGIVKNHGGTITLASEVGKGSSFSVFLPLAEGAPDSAQSKSPATQPRAGRGQILLVDDHSVIRDVTSQMLALLGYDVVTASDGTEAVEYYRENSKDVDLVIIDMVMPKMGAKECFRKIRGIDPNVRAILSTGYVNNNAVQEIMNEGMVGFVQKPYQLGKLSEIVASALENSPTRPVA